MTSLPRRLGVLAVLVVALGSAPARADVISPDQAACQGKAAGAACDADGKPGHCAASTCSRNDYSNGPPPKTVQVPCTVCVPGAPAAKAPPAGAARKDKGCAVGGEHGAAGSVLLGLALLLAARRRRR